ncbi:MAG: hypothetical protein R2910_11915 [Gemmatimonadales bacterium]
MVSAIRRVAVVTRVGAVDEMRALVGAVPGISARVITDLHDVPWPDTDCLWLHDVSLPSPELLPWISSGGRLLATLSAVQTPVTLGIEVVPPDDVRDTLWEADPADTAPRGLACFGPHPLVAGLPLGTCTWVPRSGEPYRWATHLATRPASARIVALEMVELALNPARVVAWEYAVGDGGILCIGSGIHPPASGSSCTPQLQTLLGNALAGQGIPHRDRLLAARRWPAPATQVLRQDLLAVPELPGLSGDWPDAAASLVARLSAEAPHRWRFTGRRASLDGGDGHGLGEAWIHPYAVARDAAVAVSGTALAGATAWVSPTEVLRRATVGGTPVTERWTVALEHPVVYWEVAAAGDAAIHIEWTTDLRRAWPYPAGGGGDLELALAAGGRHAALRAVGDPFQLIIDVEGGTLEAAPTDGPAVRFSLRGIGRCRVRFTGGPDAGDLERSRVMLARRAFAGVRKQRADHARELATYATSIDSPEPPLAEAFEWAKVEMDGGLAGVPGVGRCLALPSAGPERPGGAWFAGPAGSLRAMAQLAAGDRNAPRDTLKFMSLTQDVDGRIAEGCSTSGLGRFGTTPAVPLYLLLAARYANWTGELDFLAQRWGALRRAYEIGVASHPCQGAPADAALWAAACEAVQPLAEALGHPEVAEEIGAAAGAARSAAGSATFLAGPAGLADFQQDRFAQGLEAWRRLSEGLLRRATGADLPAAVASLAVEGLWGVRPNALEGAVRLAPWFPPEWDAMALERLRVGRTVLTIRVRRRFGQVAARVERVHGPRMHVEFQLRGIPTDAIVQVDDVELRGGRAAFEADGTHALVWHS